MYHFFFVVLTHESGNNPEVKTFYTVAINSKLGTTNICN